MRASSLCQGAGAGFDRAADGCTAAATDGVEPPRRDTMPGPRRILVALDDPSDRALAVLLLGQALPEDTVQDVADPIAFAEALVSAAPAAVVTALRLAWADGIELLRAVRRHHPGVAAVLFDASPGEDLAARLPAIQVDRFVRRSSAGFLELPGAVRQALDHPVGRRAGPEPDPAYRQLVEDAPVGLFSVAPDGTLTRANPAFSRVLGLPAAMVPVGLSLDTLLGSAAPRIARTGVAGEGAAIHEPEVCLPGPQGESRWVTLDLWPVRDPAGSLVRLDGVVQDITALKAAVREVESARAPRRDRAGVEQLAYAVSHDLQEPLQVLSRHARLLSERYGKRLDAEGERFLGHLLGNATRMQSMLDGLLEYARAGREEAALAPVDFSRALDEALGNLHASIEEAHAEIRHTLLPTLPADYRQIVRLFQNLVSNALKFRGADLPRVIIGARERDADWRFAVKDNGIGIDPRFHQRIFGMFQRLHTAEEYPGTGVGLALCKRIVEGHGGEIWVHSAPGEGSTFFFTVPKQAIQPGPAAAD